jgi:8-oxo-dGTP pyrophosphatase MutT (NUDIX family)
VLTNSIDAAIERLRQLQPRRRWWRHWARRASVAILLREREAGLEVLMIERAQRAGDPWSGHMAFPGGMQSGADRHSLAAAVRETDEEIGLDLHTVVPIARLSEIYTPSHRGPRPMLITPYVFVLHDEPAFTFNHEVADALWVPLHFLADLSNRGDIRWRHLLLPCYLWQGRRIWGLSLQMLEELLNQLRVR